MAWPDIQGFGGAIRKFKGAGPDAGTSLALIVGEQHALNLDEAVKFGFVETVGVEAIANAVELPAPLRSGAVRVFIAPKTTFLLSELVKFVPGFDRSMIAKETPPVVQVNFGGLQPQKNKVPANPPAEPTAGRGAGIAPRPKEKIVDAGVKIGRARKDFYSRRVVGSDVAEMTESERKTFLKKTKLWPYSPSGARENGTEFAVAAFIQHIRINMAECGVASLVTPEAYVEFCNVLAGELHAGVKTKAQLFAALQRLHENPAYTATVTRFEDSTYPSKMFRRAYKALTLLKDAPRIVKSAAGLPLEQVRSGDLIVFGYNDHVMSDFTPSPTDSPETAKRKTDAMNAHWDKICRARKAVPASGGGTTVEKALKPERPHLDALENAWLARNPDDANRTAQDLMDRFGFRGIEFGEWLPQDERQTVLNEAYAACGALVEVLGLPDRMASLNGELAIAFGSRGKGKAAAHFEPDLWVFNLTRMNGAGSMAHEWGHALDYWLARMEWADERRQGGLPADASQAPLASLMERVSALSAPVDEAVWQDKYATACNLGTPMYKILHGAMSMVRTAIEKSAQPELAMADLEADIGKRLNYAASWIVDWSKKDGMEKMIAALREATMHIYGLEVEGKDLPEVDRSYNAFRFADRSRITVAEGKHLPGTSGRRQTLDDFQEYILQKLEQTGCLDKSSLAKKKNRNNYELLMCRVFSHMQDYRRYLTAPTEIPALPSQFFREAERLDEKRSKDYSATGKELFARAFESYVFDKLQEIEMPCDYLVHSVEGSRFADKGAYTGNPYPSGNERRQINEAMARLANVVSEHARDDLDDVPQPMKMRA